MLCWVCHIVVCRWVLPPCSQSDVEAGRLRTVGGGVAVVEVKVRARVEMRLRLRAMREETSVCHRSLEGGQWFRGWRSMRLAGEPGLFVVTVSGIGVDCNVGSNSHHLSPSTCERDVS